MTGENKNELTVNKPLTLWNLLFRVIQGAIIGIGAILPGISGGVLCVVFGIYRPMMALLAHPIRTFKVHAKLILPVLVGWVAGFMAFAGLVKWFLQEHATIAVWLFVGLIAGMMPSLFKDAGKKGRPVSSWVALVLSTIIIFGILFYLENGMKINIEPNIFWFFVCGLFWGISLVLPGMSSSSILLFLGLYEPMSGGLSINHPDFAVIIPFLIGIFLIVLISARAINYLFEKHYPVAFNTILGFVIASTLALIFIPTKEIHILQFKDLAEIIISTACAVGGFAIALWMDKLGQKIKPKDEES